MADGPGARIVDRVGVLVLPDTSKFQPALKKYLERISRTAKVEVGVDLDESGLKRDAQAAAKGASQGAKVKATADLSDGFLSQMQRDVTAAMRQIEADVPLTADGERLRREARSKVAALQSQMARMALEVPLDPEADAAAKADLKGEIAELQAIASANDVEIGVDVDRSALRGLSGGSGGFGLPALPNPGILGIAVGAALALGAALGAIPAIMSAIAAPIGTIVLGWEGIALAAQQAKPGFESLQTAVEARFAEDLAPVFRELGDALPQLIPAFEGLASALSGAFGEVIGQLTSPEGIAKIDGIIRNITEAVELLSPVLGPMVDTFLEFALTGTQAFVDNAPGLLFALQSVTDIFQFLNDSGILKAAVDGFSALVTGSILLAGIVGGGLITAFGLFSAGIQGIASFVWDLWTAIQSVIPTITTLGSTILNAFLSLPGLILGALVALPGMLIGFFTGVWSSLNSLTGGWLGRLVGWFLTLPARILAAVASLPGLVLGLFSRLWSMLVSSTSGGIGRVVGFFLTLPARALGAIASLPGLLVGLISRTFSSMGGTASGGVGRVVGIIAGLPGAALGAIAALPGMLVGLIARTFSSMTGTSSGGVGRVVGVIASLPGRAMGVIASLPGLMLGVISNAFGQMASAAGGGVGRVVGVISGLGGSIMGAIAGIPGQLYGAGANMISSLASGMTSQLASVASASFAAARKVASAFPGSPVKEGPLKSWNYGGGVSGAGRKLIGGLAAGMNAERSAAARAARGVAGSVASPFDATSVTGAGGSMEAAVERALSGWQPSVALSGREYFGSMQRTRRERKGR